MTTRRTLATDLGMLLVVGNVVCWGIWLGSRRPFSPTECALLQAKRSERDLSAGPGPSFLDSYVRSDHLLFSRPVRALADEPLPTRVLAAANILPLAASWSFVVPSASSSLGPTCGESRTCGILFLILSAAQWGLVGVGVGRLLMSRQT